MRRHVVPELMDRPELTPAQLAASLQDLRVVNRWLGGAAAVVRRLGPLILRLAERGARPVRLLDVGTGSADLPLRLVDWSRRREVELRVTAVDRHRATLALARAATAGEPAVAVLRADALHLPFDSAAFHLALCSTTLHHFDDGAARRVIAELDRVTSHGFLVSDLRRTRSAWLGARALAATLWRRHPITRHDGPVSVAGAFTPAELEELARQAGVTGAVARSEPIFRVSLLVDRTRAEPEP